MSRDALEMVLILCIIGGLGFGFWRGSIGAGLFMAVILFVVWFESSEWREKGGKQ